MRTTTRVLSALTSITLVLGLVTVVPAGPASALPTDGSAGRGDPYYPTDGNGGYDVGHYDIAIRYVPTTHHMTGKATITATSTQVLTAFNLDFSGPRVSAVTVNGKRARFNRNGKHELTVRPSAPLLPGARFVVAVDYAGVQRDTGGEGWTYSPSGGAFAAGEPHSATSWYPLNDTVLDKATFTLHVTVPAEWDVVSNGVRTGDVRSGDQRTVTWRERSPIIGYLTTVAIDKFTYLKQRRANGTPLISAFAPSATARMANEKRLPEILDFMESVYGPYPFSSGGGIYVDTALPFSLETQTRPVYAPWTDLSTVIHENAHQWWGDSMSIRQWRDICLNECFASYTADFLWPERKEGVNPDKLYRATVKQLRARPKYWSTPLYNPGRGNEFGVVYFRGPLFLHALRRAMGDRAFFAGLREFPSMHKYGNASIPEFAAFMQTKTLTNLVPFFNAWLNGTRVPADEFLYPGSLHR